VTINDSKMQSGIEKPLGEVPARHQIANKGSLMSFRDKFGSDRAYLENFVGFLLFMCLL